METPIGFVTLYEAVDTVGRAVLGTNWHHPPRRDVHQRVITMIAEGCEAGEIAAGYRAWSCGVDDLDRSAWRMPHWRNYFAKGMIELDLPLVDERGRPNSHGHTSRCTCEIFVRRNSLERFIATLETEIDKGSRGGRFASSDAPLLQDALKLVAAGKSIKAASDAVAGDAEGGGTFESRSKRIARALAEMV